MRHQLNLVDLIVVAVVVLVIAGALRRRNGLLGAAGAGVGALLLAWLAVVGLATWAPHPVSRVAADSTLLHTVPAPERAVDQARQLVGDAHR